MNGFDEFELIARYLSPLAADAAGAFGLMDDAALFDLEQGESVVVTTDSVVAGIHFFADDPPSDIARKALRVNLSDLAAMGARPRAYTLAAVLPPETTSDWLVAFAVGLRMDQAEFGLDLLGGDTVAGLGPLTLTITALGTTKGGHILRRSCAVAGETIYVTGTVGDAALGLQLLRGHGSSNLVDEILRDELISRYRRPNPRTDLGQALPGVASAAIDISDGLLADLRRLCVASGLAAEIELTKVPMSVAALLSAAAALPDDELEFSGLYDIERFALTGGDDYELLFTAPSSATREVEELGRTYDVAITAIGRTRDGEGVVVRGAQGEALEIPDGGHIHSWQNQDS